MEAKQLVRPVLSLLVLSSSACFIYNAMGDDTELRREASRVACGADGEEVSPWRVGRYPIWQSYGFRCSSGSVDVTCTRAFYLVGDYTCRWDSGNAPPSQPRDTRGPAPTSSRAPASPSAR